MLIRGRLNFSMMDYRATIKELGFAKSWVSLSVHLYQIIIFFLTASKRLLAWICIVLHTLFAAMLFVCTELTDVFDDAEVNSKFI